MSDSAPLMKLGSRLADLLDDDHFNECEQWLLAIRRELFSLRREQQSWNLLATECGWTSVSSKPQTEFIRERLQASNEPVAWMVKCGGGSESFATEQWQIAYYIKERNDCVITALYAAPVARPGSTADAMEKALQLARQQLDNYKTLVPDAPANLVMVGHVRESPESKWAHFDFELPAGTVLYAKEAASATTNNAPVGMVLVPREPGGEMKLPMELAELFQESPNRMITMFTREDVEVIVRDCAQTAAMLSIRKNQIHPDISWDAMSETAQRVAHTTCQCVAEAILDRYGLGEKV